MVALPHILIIEAPYYTHIAADLCNGAQAALHQKATFDIIQVPGALEIPAAVKIYADTGLYDGFIVLGCVIRGETSHYDIVAGESARAVMDLTVQNSLAIGNGILTVENEAQAIQRAKIDQLNKGGGAAEACLAMIHHKAIAGKKGHAQDV
ncbi:MAG: 6,7-dimethyl-8-ribityllumazine synthase [Pseudomonadota bacterium]